jgi:NhaP-type Na+/H+ or K+/H+ antiporter
VGFVDIAVLAVFVVGYGFVSRRLETTPVTGPILFVGAGILLGEGGLGVLESGMGEGVVRVLAEATLVLLLFTDAIRIDLMRLRVHAELPIRLLGVGLPLTLIAGAAAAAVVFPAFGMWEAALLAAILTPTDAALGQAVVSNPKVPVRIRQALNVESGLNDGMMLPIITALLALAAVEVDLETPRYWVQFAAAQIGLGVLVGAAVGWLGGRALHWFAMRNWIDGAFRQLATLGIGVGAFALAEIAHGNGFVAAFVAGIAFGAAAREECEGAYDFAEDEGQLLALLTFLYFGAALAGPALGELTWQIGLYAFASLTVVRMLPVALSLIGLHLKTPTVAYLGWFGPRGLASILFGLFVLEEANLPVADELLLVVTWTVLLSVVLHGVSAFALSERYGSWFAIYGRPDMAEAMEVEEMPLR